MKFKSSKKHKSLILNQGDVLLNVTGIESYSSSEKKELQQLMDKISQHHNIKTIKCDKNNKIKLYNNFRYFSEN